MMAGSDDHGVKEAMLRYQQGKELPTSKNLLEGREPQTEFRATETLDLEKLRAKPGDKMTYWLTVRDNKEYKGSNKFETAHQIIEISEPLPPEEKKKLEEKQAQERQQLDQGQSGEPRAVRPRIDQADNPPRTGRSRMQKDRRPRPISSRSSATGPASEPQNARRRPGRRGE